MEKRSADEVLREKYEERGWFDMYEWQSSDDKILKPLPMTEDEYREFSSLLARMALHDNNQQLCEMYFELQRRAVYGNGYYPLSINEEEEMQMWSLGTGEIIQDNKRALH